MSPAELEVRFLMHAMARANDEARRDAKHHARRPVEPTLGDRIKADKAITPKENR